MQGDSDKGASSKQLQELHQITTDIVSSVIRNWLRGKALHKFIPAFTEQVLFIVMINQSRCNSYQN